MNIYRGKSQGLDNKYYSIREYISRDVISRDVNKINRQKREPMIALGVKNSKACSFKLGQIHKLKQTLIIAHVSRGVERKKESVII